MNYVRKMRLPTVGGAWATAVCAVVVLFLLVLALLPMLMQRPASGRHMPTVVSRYVPAIPPPLPPPATAP